MKPLRKRTDLWEKAQARLKRIGFEFANLSMDGETAYWRWPGKEAQLRVSLHGRKHKGRHPHADRVVSSLSFGGGVASNSGVPPHLIPMSDGAFDGHLARAIGMYFLKACEGGD